MTKPSHLFREVSVDRLPKLGKRLSVEANQTELEALKQRFDLESFNYLEAKIHLKPAFGRADCVVEGSFAADYAQTCGVTLVRLPQKSAGEFKRLYKVDESAYDVQELVVDIDEADPPDLIPSGKIDLGELITEEFGLTLDQFPRAAGATFDDVTDREENSATVEKDNPFAALEKLRDKWRN